MKSSLIKRFAAALAILLIFAAITGCGSADPSPEDSSVTAENQADPESGEGTIVFSPEMASLAVIRSDYSGKTITDAAVRLRKSMEESFGSTVKINTDWEKNETYEYELIVGDTLREELWNFEIDTLPVGEKGFIIAEHDGKVFIVGGSDTGTSLAVDWFISNIVESSDGSFAIESGFYYQKEQEYDIPALYVNGLDTAGYSIVCEGDYDNEAKELQQLLYSKTGKWHEITSDMPDGGAFVLSGDDCPAAGLIRVREEDGSLIFSSSSSYYGMSGCIWMFSEEYIYPNFGPINFPEGFEYCDLGDSVVVNY